MNAALLAHLTGVDGGVHSAWVAAVNHHTGSETVGVARAIRLDDPRGAEVAITVVDAYRRRGIGRLLLATLVLEAAEQGVTRFVGLVLAGNAPMRAVLRRAGARLYPEEAGTCRFEVDVPATAGDRTECRCTRWCVRWPGARPRCPARSWDGSRCYRTPASGPSVPGLINWLFRDRTTGRITVVQWPNLPLWIFIVASVVRRVLDPTGTAGSALQLIATGGLLWWAADEVLRGVNPWRRILGGGMLVTQLVKLLAR